MSARRFISAGLTGLALAAVLSTAVGASVTEPTIPTPETAYEGIVESCGSSEVVVASVVSKASVSGPIADLCAGQKAVDGLAAAFADIVDYNGTADAFQLFFKSSATVKPLERTYENGVLRSFIPARTTLTVSMVTLDQGLFYDGLAVTPGCSLAAAGEQPEVYGWAAESACEVKFSHGGQVKASVSSMALSGASTGRKVMSVEYELSFNHTVDFPADFISLYGPEDLEEFPTVILDPQEIETSVDGDTFAELPTVTF